jgi:hypothetical protein
MRKLTLVVTCSERKTLRPAPNLRIRTLPAGSTETRVGVWNERLNSASTAANLFDLYSGEHWTQCKTLMLAAASAGFAPDLWIASAGLGLQAASSRAPAYGATFAHGHADSVATTSASDRDWWSELQRLRGGGQIHELARRGPTLIVLSAAYGRALQPQLLHAAQHGDETVLVGGSAAIPGMVRVAADRRLRQALGGTLTGLNARMATRWLQHLESGEPLSSARAARRWQRWVDRVAREERYERASLTDDQVRIYIRDALGAGVAASRTRLLQTLRTDGKACEQSRFAALYAEVAEAS